PGRARWWPRRHARRRTRSCRSSRTTRRRGCPSGSNTTSTASRATSSGRRAPTRRCGCTTRRWHHERDRPHERAADRLHGRGPRRGRRGRRRGRPHQRRPPQRERRPAGGADHDARPEGRDAHARAHRRPRPHLRRRGQHHRSAPAPAAEPPRGEGVPTGGGVPHAGLHHGARRGRRRLWIPRGGRGGPLPRAAAPGLGQLHLADRGPRRQAPARRVDPADRLLSRDDRLDRRRRDEEAEAVRSTWNANLIREDAANASKDAGAFLVPRMFTDEAIYREGKRYGIGAHQIQKINLAREQSVQGLTYAYRAGCKIGSGSDLLGDMMAQRAVEFELKAQVMTPMEVLLSATRVNAELFRRSDRIGTVEPGKYADLIVVTGNPLRNLRVLQTQDNRTVIMK